MIVNLFLVKRLPFLSYEKQLINQNKKGYQIFDSRSFRPIREPIIIATKRPIIISLVAKIIVKVIIIETTIIQIGVFTTSLL